MIDLNTLNSKFYEIKLTDGSILRLKKPTQNTYIELASIKDLDRNNPAELLMTLRILTTKIFNGNAEGRIFTEDEIGEMMPLEIMLYVLTDYLNFAKKDLGEL